MNHVSDTLFGCWVVILHGNNVIILHSTTKKHAGGYHGLPPFQMFFLVLFPLGTYQVELTYVCDFPIFCCRFSAFMHLKAAICEHSEPPALSKGSTLADKVPESSSLQLKGPQHGARFRFQGTLFSPSACHGHRLGPLFGTPFRTPFFELLQRAFLLQKAPGWRGYDLAYI